MFGPAAKTFLMEGVLANYSAGNWVPCANLNGPARKMGDQRKIGVIQ
jgi:hypothetical protein